MPAKKILVADDSLTIQKVIRLALSNEGYDIQAVSDGNDAVQQIAVFRPDVVLVDVSLPGKSAFEVKRATDAEPSSAHVRFVLMSSAFERVDEQQARELRFHGQLTKPFDPAHLRKVLTDVLATAPANISTPGLSAPLAAPPVPPPVPQFQDSPPPLPPSPPAMDFGNASLEISELDSAPGMSDSFSDVPPPPPSFGSLNLDLPPFEALPAPAAVAPAPPPTPQSQQQTKANPPSSNPDDLWDMSNQPPELPPVMPRSPDDSDIRHLTESTIRMSGLDDFDWSVNEPSLKPSPEMADLSSANFPFGTPQQQSRELPPMPGASIPLSPGPLGSSSSNQDFSFGPPAEQTLTETLQLGGESPVTSGESSQFQPYPGQGISRESMEQMIQKEVQAALEKVAQRILPDIAERVIKQEIHRLLSEQP